MFLKPPHRARGLWLLFVSLIRFGGKHGAGNLSQLAWLRVRSSQRSETLEMSVFRTSAGG